MSENPKVFISYSHEQDKDYEQKLLRFANKLRSEGIDASIDLYEEAPEEGWPRWMENQIRWADYVLVVASKSYYDKCYGSQKEMGLTGKLISYTRISTTIMLKRQSSFLCSLMMVMINTFSLRSSRSHTTT